MLLNKKLLAVLTVLVWTTAIVASFGKFKLAAKPPLKILLKTTPEVIKLVLDRERMFNNNYTKTPTVISISPGRHKIRVIRQGYISHSMTVEGGSGDTFKMDSVVLEKNSNTSFSTIHIISDEENPNLYVDIDNGYHQTELPVEIDDLESNKNHTITAFPNWPERRGFYRCRFKPKATIEAPHEIKFSTRNSRLRATGCRKLRSKK